MALKAFHTCDHCGKVLDEMNEWIGMEIDECYPYRHHFDLCNQCMEELNNMISAFIKEAKEADVNDRS